MGYNYSYNMSKGEKMKLSIILYLILVGAIGLTLLIGFILFKDVIHKLEEACNEYDMDYEYREGANCLDKENVLHPISSDCGKFRWDECEIRFINLA